MMTYGTETVCVSSVFVFGDEIQDGGGWAGR